MKFFQTFPNRKDTRMQNPKERESLKTTRYNNKSINGKQLFICKERMY